MPKRVIDGEGLWRSDKLTQIRETWIKAEYANLLPLALANGSFEANPRRIWSTVYSYNRPEITLEQVEQILAELERVKLLFRWTDARTGKNGGYFVGIEKPGRLPSPSRLKQGHEVLGPELPKQLLQSFITGSATTGQPMATQTVTDGSIGFGFCSGLGSGSGSGSPMASQGEINSQSSGEDIGSFNSVEVARALCFENGWSGTEMIWALQAAIDFQSPRMPDLSLLQVGKRLVKAYFNHLEEKGKFAVQPKKFFEQRLYPSDQGSISKANVLTDNPATRALAQMEGA